MAEKNDIVLDVCGLQPPEPLERVLEALSSMDEGRRLRMLIDREPRPLYRILDGNGYRHETRSLPESLYEILIWRES